MEAQDLIFWKSKCRKVKSALLSSRAVLQSTLQMVDRLLEENEAIDLDDTFYEPAEREAAKAAAAQIQLQEKEWEEVDFSANKDLQRGIDADFYGMDCIADPWPKVQDKSNSEESEPEISDETTVDYESQMEINSPPRSSTPEGHICKLPRCWLHQPFRATAREVKGLSKEEAALRSKEPAYSPKGFWDLDI